MLLDDGRFLVAGTRRAPEEGPRRFVAALTADGQVAWRDTYGPGRIDDAARVPDGGALLVGGDRATVVTPNGAEIRSERYEDADIEAAARLADGYVLAGATTGDPDRLLLRIDGTGDREWREVRRGDGPDRFTDAVVEGDAVIVAGAAPPAGGTGVRPTVAIYHGDGTREWSATHRGGADGTGVAIAPAGSGAVAAVPHNGSGRLVGFEGGDSAGVTGLVASPRAVTVLGDGRYLVTGERDGDAWAGVVAPGFASPAGLAPADGTDREPDDSGDGDGTARDGSGGGTDDGGGRPSVPVGGPSTVVTGLLVAAALVASLVAVAVSVLAWRRL